MKKFILFSGLLFLFGLLFAESSNVTIPALFYQSNHFEGLQSSYYGGALVFKHLKDKDDTSIESEGLSAQFTYIMDKQKENALWEDNSNTLQSMVFQGIYNTGKHQVVLIAQDKSDKVFSSRKGTMVMAGYGYQLCDNQKWSCYVGGGLFMTPVQIGSVTLPVVPLPIVRAAYKSDQVFATFDFLGSPALNCIFFTQNHLRLVTSLQVNGYSSLRDIGGQVALRYYFKPEDETLQGLNLQFGVENTVMQYGLKNEKVYTSQNWGVFAAFDAVVLKLQGGYNFDGIQKIDEKVELKTGKGWYFSAQGMVAF